MSQENRKELIVSAIENGTVIDHIPSDKVFKVMRILNLETAKQQILFGVNLESKKFGKKGIVKVQDKFFEVDEINKIALVAPTATIIVIRNFEVVEKHQVTIPQSITGITKCFNPKCITNFEPVTTKFDVVADEKNDVSLVCHYCEKITKKEHIQFL
jgi:aspartate carbamoyltransferase regulatory subunit